MTPRRWTPATRTLSVDVDGGLLDDATWSQGPCVPTQRVELTLDANGRFDTVAAPWALAERWGGMRDILRVAVSGAFVGGGAALSGVRARVTLEAHEAAMALGAPSSPDTCFLDVLTDGVLSCTPCLDGTGACVELDLVARAGAAIEGWTPTPRTGEEVDADESCRGGAGSSSARGVGGG